MPFIIFFFSLAILCFLLTKTASPAVAGAIAFALSIVAGVVTQELRELLGIEKSTNKQENQTTEDALKKVVPLKVHTSVFYIFEYIDLSFLLTASTFIMSFFYDAVIVTIQELVSKNFISFPKGDDGFIHLQTYIAGFTTIPIFLLILASYGIYVGYKKSKISIWRLTLSIEIGVIMAAVLQFLIEGKNISLDNFNILANLHSDLIPTGAIAFKIFTVVGMQLLFVFILALYSSLFGALGIGLSRGMRLLRVKCGR